MKIVVISYIREVDRIGMRVSRKSCVARTWEEWRHLVSKFRRAVSIKIIVEDSKRCNIAAECKRLCGCRCCCNSGVLGDVLEEVNIFLSLPSPCRRAHPNP